MSDFAPLVSVIVPNYNHARYLGQRLSSVYNQTFRDFEVIFLDDASTDNSIEVFKKFSVNAETPCHINEKNSGSTFVQWNRGAKLAKGKYIWFAESDDFCEPEFLQKTVPILEEFPNIGLVYTQSTMVDQQGEKLGLSFLEIWRSDPQRWFSNFMNNGRSEIENYLCLENTIPNASATLIRKSVFDAVGGAKEYLKLHGDYVLWFDILLNSDIAFIAEPLNFFRFSDSSVRKRTSIFGFDIEERYEITKYMFTRVKLNPDLQSRICYNLVKYWLHPDRVKTPLSRHLRIIKLASIIDKKLIWHLLKRFFIGPVKFLYMETYGRRKRKNLLNSSYVYHAKKT